MLETKLLDETTIQKKLHQSLGNANDYVMQNYRKYTCSDGENIAHLNEDNTYYN